MSVSQGCSRVCVSCLMELASHMQMRMGPGDDQASLVVICRGVHWW